MYFLETTLLTITVDYVARRTKYFNSYYTSVWYNGKPIILAREILILNVFSWNIEMTMFDIYIKKQINKFLFVDVVGVKIILTCIDKKFSKVFYSQNWIKMCCDNTQCCDYNTLWEGKKILKMRSPRPWLLYWLFVLGKYPPLFEPQFLFCQKFLIIANDALLRRICGSQTVVPGPVYQYSTWELNG